jgi:hypothetical protein
MHDNLKEGLVSLEVFSRQSPERIEEEHVKPQFLFEIRVSHTSHTLTLESHR